MNDKPNRIAVVFSGGGTKGVYSAGTVNALMQVGLKPDVLTGSSIGAINAVLLTEMLLEKKKFVDLEDYLNFWETLSLDANRKKPILSSKRFTPIVIGTACTLIVLFLSHIHVLPTGISFMLGTVLLGLALKLLARWYLYKFNIGTQNTKKSSLKEKYIRNISFWFDFLTFHKYNKSLFSNCGLKQALIRIGIPSWRTFKDYAKEELYVVCTRTNLRTGKKELSEYLPDESLRSGRGRITGNPLVIPASLASAAFPAALPPVSVVNLYSPNIKENHIFWAIMRKRAEVKEIFQQFEQELINFRMGYQVDGNENEEYRIFMEYLGLWELRRLEDALNAGTEEQFDSYVIKLLPKFLEYYINKRKLALVEQGQIPADENVFDRLRPKLLKHLENIWKYRDYPRASLKEYEYNDYYIDGGVADNTPLSAALMKLKDIKATNTLVLTVFLNPPRFDFWSSRESEEAKALEIGGRGLNLQASNDLISDIKNVGKVNDLLRKTELESDKLLKLSKIEVKVKSIFPDEKVGWVFAVDERFGYDRNLYRALITTGCRNTLEALLQVKEHLPKHVQQNLNSIVAGEGLKKRCVNRKCRYYCEDDINKGLTMCNRQLFLDS